MNRTITIAAAAALLLCAPAFAEESIHISTVGKSAPQIRLEVKKAAEYLCFKETRGMVGYLSAQAACVNNAVTEALAQSRDPALLLASK